MFSPTQKQLQAISNIEKFIGINSNKTQFEDYNDFQTYFDLLSKKAKKKAKLLDDVIAGNITFDEINKLKKEKKDKYYSVEANLRAYAIDYINKFFPTLQKLLDKLNEKTSASDTVNKVFEDVKKYICEEKMIDNLIESLISRGKNLKYIKLKLITKKFDSDLISKKLSKLKDGNTLLDSFLIEKQVINYKNKQKSINYIKQKLIERPEDRELVEEIIQKIFGNNIELDIISNEIQKLKDKGYENTKIIQKLIAKGFRYEDIKNLINN